MKFSFQVYPFILKSPRQIEIALMILSVLHQEEQMLAYAATRFSLACDKLEC